MPNTAAMSVSVRESEIENETVTERGKEETGTGSETGRGGGRDHWTGTVRQKAVAEREMRRSTDLAGMWCGHLCVL